MPPNTQIEVHIQQLCESKRIRVQNFFIDFDKLRSGIITASQFVRTLWMNLGLKLSAEEERHLLTKFNAGDGRVDYRRFCDCIDSTKSFDPNNLTVPPQSQLPIKPELLGTWQTVRPLSPNSEQRLLTVLDRLSQHYRLGGYSLRAAFKEFDRHNIGCVTESQFYRALPLPKEFGEAETALLARRYADPDREGLVSYLNLKADIEAIEAAGEEEERRREGLRLAYERREGKPRRLAADEQPPLDSSVEMLLQRIRAAVHKHGVRILDFLRDHDPLRHDLITENQFVKSLLLAIGKQAGLTIPDCQQLANFYSDGAGRVRYRDFAIAMDSPYHEHRLEKRPTAVVTVPAMGSLARKLASVSDAEEAEAEAVLQEIRKQVLERRLMVYQYFKDFDRSKAYTRVMTPEQFGRSLHFLTLDVSPEQLKILARKFADPATGDVNYPAFAESVDPDFHQQSVTHETDLATRAANASRRDWDSVVEKPVVTLGDCATFEELMVRIRYVVASTGARIKDFFVDFDQLRSGSITRSQFQRCLSQIGLSKLGWHDLSSRQLEMLCQHYGDSDGKVRWTDFVNDVDSVFTLPNLEKQPFTQVPPTEIFSAPKPGTKSWRGATDEQLSIYKEALERLQQKVAQRRMLVRPTFQDFDRHRRGTVTRSQFRQAMAMLNLHCEEAELEAIEARFYTDEGVNYDLFLNSLEPQQPIEFMYSKRMEELRLVQSRTRLPDSNPASDSDQVLWRIRTKVVRQRIRVHEFLRDFDRLRSGRINKVTFRRALAATGLDLCESEFCHLEDCYQSNKDPESVEWMRFVEDVESAFTQFHLEKQPLSEPSPFQPEPESSVNCLPQQAEEMVERMLGVIAEQVRQRRTLMLPFFESFDRVHNGKISQNQFRRVLTDLGIIGNFSSEEWAAMFAKFRHRVGSRDDVNYFHFVDAVYLMAGFDPRKP